MSLFRGLTARKDGTRGTAAIEVRKGLEGLFTGPGVLPGAASPLVAGSAGWAYTVNAAHFVTKRAAGDGVHLFGNDGPVTVGTTGVGSTVPAAPGSGLSRIDIIWVRHRSASENSDTTSDPDFGVTSGTAGAPGLAPTIPSGALELARNTMASSATTTASSGNTITQTAARTLLTGTDRTPRLVDVGLRTSQVLIASVGWTTVASVTGATVADRRVTAEWDGVAFNGASGADRAITWRLVCDGAVIGPVSGGTQAVPLAGTPRVYAGHRTVHAPAAGAHTWELQANASAATAVFVESASLMVTEWPLL